ACGRARIGASSRRRWTILGDSPCEIAGACLASCGREEAGMTAKRGSKATRRLGTNGTRQRPLPAPARHRRSDDGTAFMPDPEDGPARIRDDLAENLAEDYVQAATQGMEVEEDHDQIVPEELGGPVVETRRAQVCGWRGRRDQRAGGFPTPHRRSEPRGRLAGAAPPPCRGPGAVRARRRRERLAAPGRVRGPAATQDGEC